MGKVVESIVRSVREREVLAFRDHVLKGSRCRVDRSAVREHGNIVSLCVMAEDHQHEFQGRILPFPSHCASHESVRARIEGTSEVVNHGAAHGARSFEFRIRRSANGWFMYSCGSGAFSSTGESRSRSGASPAPSKAGLEREERKLP